VSRLGWSQVERLAGDKQTRRWQARRRDGQKVTLELETEPGNANHGVAALELSAGKDTWSLHRDTCIHVRGPDIPTRVQPARSHSDAELLASALGQPGNDTIFRDALAKAGELVRAAAVPS
jgi:hypothetical protein